MSEVIGNPRLEIEVGKGGFDRGLDAAAAALGASMQKSERLAAAGAKRIQKQIDTLNATKPRQAMFELTQAVQKMGGVSALSADQVARLKKQVDGLAAAGAKLPTMFAKLGGPAGGGLGAAGSAAASAAAGGLAPGGAIGAGLIALGPAGIAAAASIGGIAAAAAGAASAVGSLVERAGNLTDLSEKTGLSTDALQKLDFVGSQVGVSLDASAGAVSKLQRTLGEAAQGSTKAREAFAAIGVSWQDLRGLAPEEQFARVSSALATIPDQERLVAAGSDLMGRSFTEIIPLVRHAHEVISAPVALDETVIKQADDLGDAFTRLGKATDELKMSIGLAFLQGFTGGRDAAGAVDTLTGAVAGLASMLRSDAFVEALQWIDTFTFRIGPAVDALAELGRAEMDAAKADQQRAKMIADANQQAITGLTLQSDARKKDREEAEKAAKEGIRLAKERARKEEELRQGALRSMRALAEEERQFRLETFKREHAAAEKFWADQVKLAQDATRHILADALLKHGGSRERINALGEKVSIISEEEARAAARREAAANIGIAVEDVTDDMLGVASATGGAVAETIEWKNQLEIAANIIQGMPGGLGKVGNAIGSVAAGIAGIAASKQAFDKAAAARAAGGGIGSLLGMGGAILGGVSAAIGIGKAIVGLFKGDPVKKAQKEAGRILGKGISREMAEQFVEESKRTGKSVAQVAKAWQAEQEKAAAEAKRKNVEEGLGAARSGLEALLGDIAKLQATPELQAAIAGIEAKVADAIAKSGLGFMATGALRTSEAFGAAQAAARSGGQVLAGMRQAGMVDAGLQGAMTSLATELQRQAIEAARAAGLSETEAAKAGSGAIVDILREQLNASLASGRELDANTKALIDEARANGIEIIADPMLQQLQVQQQSLAQLEQINAAMAGGGRAFDQYGSYVSGRTLSAQAGLPPAIMPNMGRGLGPLIQTHPGELAAVVPRSRVAKGRRGLERAGAALVGEEAFAPRPGPGEEAAAARAVAPFVLNNEFAIKFDSSVSYETSQAFARAVAREARRLFDEADPQVLRSVRRRLGST